MNIWIVTTGNSDVKLKTDENWGTLFRKVRSQLYDRRFAPTQPPNTDGDEPFIVPARAMGMVYGTQFTDEYYEDLHFPLLDAFSAKLLEQGRTNPDKIIVILTNQEVVFDNEDERKLDKSPYWQDTCTLKPIFEQYFKLKFPKVKNEKIDYLELKPQSQIEGLDKWDQALVLVQKAFSTLDFDKNATVYVSHQAGTPAISSAVQFVSLAKFGKKVKFLVSNEYKQKPADVIESSTYLQGMQVQEAKALLKRYDYQGVERILKPYCQDSSEPLLVEIRDLLGMAVQWNFANFEKFGKARGEVAKERLNQWWWVGYEAAYLGIVRLRQGNTVEALFHSFRAVEGSIKEWALNEYKPQIKYSNSKQPNTAYIHDLNLPANLRCWFDSNKNRDYNNVGLFGKALFTLLEAAHSQNEWNQNSDIQVVVGNTIEERNATFHCLRGLDEKEVFQAWKTDSREKWEGRVLGCLNFVSKQKFVSLKSASLMAKVHDELVDAIARYEIQT